MMATKFSVHCLVLYVVLGRKHKSVAKVVDVVVKDQRIE